jgi:bifunctional DNA-binding transcriptional regulator/antitoxin component of YhaV-PrlF toxin-antitoxin module
LKPPPESGGRRMKLLGMTELGTNNRITIPPRAMDELKMKKGDILVFYEHDGNLVISVDRELKKRD